MPKDKAEFQHQALQDRERIAEYLRALQEGFASGALTFTNERGEMVMTPVGLVRFEVDASRKRDRARLTIRFEWKEDHRDPDDESGLLTINGVED